MGREIRRVSKGWQHPKDEHGEYIPVFNRDYEDAAREYLQEVIAWENGTHEELSDDPNLKLKYPFFWEYAGDPPEKKYYLKQDDSPKDCFQIYETVSEGTPVSPVFQSKQEMKSWLLSQGFSKVAADKFLEYERAPSFVAFGNNQIASGIESLEVL